MLQKPVTDLLMEAVSVSRKFECCFVHVLQKRNKQGKHQICENKQIRGRNLFFWITCDKVMTCRVAID